jgi:low affinity Fe/Cu permease
MGVLTMASWFRSFSQKVSQWVGSPVAFVACTIVVIIWALTGPAFQYSDTWQLIINTGTTIVTFLMVFLIQNTQNRDSRAIHLKLDELIRATKHARNEMIDLQTLSDAELDRVHKELCNQRELTEDRIELIQSHREKRQDKRSR